MTSIKEGNKTVGDTYVRTRSYSPDSRRFEAIRTATPASAIPLLLVGAFAAYDWDRPAWPSIVGLAGVGVSVIDGLCLALSFVACIHALTNGKVRRVSPHVVLCIVLITLFALSLVRGLAQNEPGLVASEARVWLQVLATCVYVVSFWDSLRRSPSTLTFLFSVIGLMIIAMGTLHFARYGLGSPDELLRLSSTELRSSRILNSGQSILLTCSFLFVLHEWLQRGGRMFLTLTILFGLFVMLAQNRSVWAAFAGAFVIYVIASDSISRTRILVISVVVIIAAFVVDSTIFKGALLNEISAEIGNRSTYNDRTEGWAYLVNQSLNSDNWTIWFGVPTGNGWLRPGPLEPVTYQPHNWYVLVYLRAGLVGLTALIVLIVGMAFSCIARRNPLALAILTGLSIYAWAYGLSWYHGVLIGILVATTSRTSSANGHTQHKFADTAR